MKRIDDIKYLLTAEEAWPVFEREVLSAEHRVVAGFRIFDCMTRLRSDEGQGVGEDWFDLILHILRRGVRVDLILSDFDPIIAPDMHEMTWRTMRQLAAIRELAGPDAILNTIPAMHPAEAGQVARTALWPKVWQELTDLRDAVNERPEDVRRTMFHDMPGTHSWLELAEDGTVQSNDPSPPPLYPVSHHQKIAVIDSRSLYVGGLDLNPRRYDTPRHHRAAEETWHDVQILVRDRDAAEAGEAHLDNLLQTVAATAEVPPQRGGFCTTTSRWQRNIVGMAPEVVSRSIADKTMQQIERSEQFLYFETQFFRDVELAEALATRAREAEKLELLMVLPAAPEDVAFEGRRKVDARYGEYLQARCVRTVMEAFGDRCFFASPAQRRDARPGQDDEEDRSTFLGAPLIYVHAKVSVFDRRAVLVSSANLNSRSLHWDTEAGLLHVDEVFATDVVARSMRHWLPETDIDMSGSLVSQVRDQAELDAVRQPGNREGYLLPYDVEKAESFGTNLPGIPAELV